MIEDHICSGDYVLVEKTDRSERRRHRGRPGGRERCYTETLLPGAGRMIRLQPANSSMQPIRVTPASLQVQGRVLAVLRKFK